MPKGIGYGKKNIRTILGGKKPKGKKDGDKKGK